MLSYPVRDNLILCTYYLRPFAEGLTINEEAVNEQATRLVREFDVRTPGIRPQRQRFPAEISKK